MSQRPDPLNSSLDDLIKFNKKPLPTPQTAIRGGGNVAKRGRGAAPGGAPLTPARPAPQTAIRGGGAFRGGRGGAIRGGGPALRGAARGGTSFRGGRGAAQVARTPMATTPLLRRTTSPGGITKSPGTPAAHRVSPLAFRGRPSPSGPAAATNSQRLVEIVRNQNQSKNAMLISIVNTRGSSSTPSRSAPPPAHQHQHQHQHQHPHHHTPSVFATHNATPSRRAPAPSPSHRGGKTPAKRRDKMQPGDSSKQDLSGVSLADLMVTRR